MAPHKSLSKRWSAIAAMLLAGIIATAGPSAIAGTFETFVGYADNLRPSAFFPAPFIGSPGVALFAGQDPSSLQLDAGAIRVLNTGATPITINELVVQLRPNASPVNFQLWDGSLGVSGFVLNPGMNAIFTQTAQFNFDTSDFENFGNERVAGDLTPGNNLGDNCSVGLTAGRADCTNNAPIVKLTIDGIVSTLSDTGHVLDTGGFDTLNATPCPPGDTAAPGNCNESLQWRDIGTTGVQNPGGSPGTTGTAVPEPASLALLGMALAGFGWFSRRRDRNVT